MKKTILCIASILIYSLAAGFNVAQAQEQSEGADFRYQLTVIGTFAQAIVASEMKDNRFVIKTNAASVKVSWMVTGVRHDAYADKHRIKVEEVKAESERGYYLHPEVFNQPEEKSIEWRGILK